MTKTPQRYYKPQEIERGLHYMAVTGSAAEAARQLRQQGVDVPCTTLKYWRSAGHAERYQEIRREVLPRIEQAMAAESEDLARAYAEGERAMVAKLMAELEGEDFPAKDLPAALQRLATARGISIDKSRILREKPTQITRTESADDIL